MEHQNLKDPQHPWVLITELHADPSKPDFLSENEPALEEADELAFWIELLLDAAKTRLLNCCWPKANELGAIAASSINAAKRNSK